MSIRDDSVEGIKWCCLRCNPGGLYRSMDNGLFLLYMPTKSYHFVCYLSECFVHAAVCASVQLEIHIPGNTNKIIDVRGTYICYIFLYLNFNRKFI